MRIGNDLVDLNIVGIIWNFNEKNLNNLFNSDFIDVRTKSNNGFDSFLNIMRASFTKNDKNTYFWIFNLEKDIVKISDYKNVSSLNMQKNIELMISELYREYVYLVKTKIIENIKKIKNINLWKLNNIISKYEEKYIF